MRKIKAILFLTLGLALFPNIASASMMPEQYPWPWPWAIDCPIRFTDLPGNHSMLNNPRVSNTQQNDRYEITNKQVSPNSAYDVWVSRYDGTKLHSWGHAYVAKGRLVFQVKMTVQGEHRSYKIRVRMGVPNSDQANQSRNECDDRSRVKTVIQVLPDKKNQQQGASYIVEPISQN